LRGRGAGFIGRSAESIVAKEKLITTPQMKTNPNAVLLSYQSMVDDYAWRFELIRSTLEDLDQLIEDEKPVCGTNRRSALRPGVSRREIALPTLTLPQLRLAAMTA